jgi:cysteine desulfurase
MQQLYLDNAATTKLNKKVENKIKKFLSKEYGNPSSIHNLGEKALKAINSSRKILSRHKQKK